MSPKLQGETLGERIANARELRGWRKVDLRRRISEYLGRDVRDYYPDRWERANKPETPGPEYMGAIVAVTGFTTEEFYDGLGMIPSSSVAAAKRSKRVADAIRDFIHSGRLSPYRPDEVRFLEVCAVADVPSLEAALLGYRLALAPDDATRERYLTAIQKLGPKRAKPESSIPRRVNPPKR